MIVESTEIAKSRFNSSSRAQTVMHKNNERGKEGKSAFEFDTNTFAGREVELLQNSRLKQL